MVPVVEDCFKGKSSLVLIFRGSLEICLFFQKIKFGFYFLLWWVKFFQNKKIIHFFSFFLSYCWQNFALKEFTIKCFLICLIKQYFLSWGCCFALPFPHRSLKLSWGFDRWSFISFAFTSTCLTLLPFSPNISLSSHHPWNYFSCMLKRKKNIMWLG